MRRSKINKEIISAKAIELFSEYGVDKVSMNDIAKELSITKPLLYYYFKDKEDIIHYAFSAKINEMTELLLKIDTSSDIKSFIYTIVDKYYIFFYKNSANIKCFFKILDSSSIKGMDQLINSSVNRIRDTIKKEIIKILKNNKRADIDAEDILTFIVSIINCLMMEIKMKREINIKRLKKVVDIFIKGFMAGLLLFLNLKLSSLDLTEDKAVVIAFEKNINIQNILTTEEVAKEKIREYYGTSYPQINFSASYTKNIEKPLGFMGGRKVEMGMKNSYSMNIGLNQILWSGGKVSSAIDLAKIYRDTSHQNVLLTKNTVRKSVRSIFYTLLYMEEIIKLREEMLSIEKQHLLMFEEKYRQGIISDINLLRQKVEVSNKEVELIKAQNTYNTTLLSFKNLLGMDLDEEIKIIGRFDYNEIKFDFWQLYSTALKNRPEYRIAFLNKEMALRNLSLEKAANYPVISLFANRQFSGASEENKFPSKDLRGWSLVTGISLNMPVFSGYSISARIRQAEENLKIAERNLKDTEKKIAIELKEAEYNLIEAQKRVESTKLALYNSHRVLQATEERFKSGLSSQLELNDVTVLYSSAKISYINAVFDYINQIINIDYITANYGGKNEK